MSDANRRWMRVGYSDRPQVRTAAAEAAEQAMNGSDPRLLIVFGPAGYPADEIAAGVAAVAGEVPFIGSSDSGHIGSGESPDVGVTVIGLGGHVVVETACVADLNARPRDAGAELGQALRRHDGSEHQLVLMFA